jgi:hypothetical protein
MPRRFAFAATIVLRGGGYVGAAGIFRVSGVSTASDAGSFIGFRAAR